jgi:hypothetical protein
VIPEALTSPVALMPAARERRSIELDPETLVDLARPA